MTVQDYEMCYYEYDNDTSSSSSYQSDQKGFYFVLLFRVCLCTPLSLWSLLTGIVNIITYYRMGLSDGVNQNFFILSVADALQGFIALVDAVCYILGLSCAVETNFNLHTVLGAVYTFPMSVSVLTTTVIAVVRCCCVTMPFTVQKTFTARRQLAAILISCGIFSFFLVYASIHVKLYQYSTDRSVFKSRFTSRMWDITKQFVQV
ncbi:hypothetical protein EGW08_004619 [Elysia chlorotica]|uniref:G-protein coupled receptors family 1 profile domain-containing protein n=1 Tax=Elysia chlorotica TaxID=188477 RepID=A0A3S1CAR2_ELYCH|nr:hypothetical protein EGW08_004619 [Elysia chlorotica]